ncbi:MAG TPA: Mur ligase family protein [Longimicrobiales bacterium]|nr:Mur ligase family protein [Longimicrobiales bacterium]
MSRLTYDQLVAELFPRLTGGIRWGLERTQHILAADGDPHLRYRTVHIGGTNGKGSVAAHVASVLQQDGSSVGLYTSPHLCTFRERIRINGRAIEESALLRAAERLWPHIEQESPSFFEATTAIAFAAFADANIDIAVVEVGLGGRLDATNVVTPDVVALTNVSLDHVQLLGPTIEHVAREKAGIIKPHVPVITGETGAAALAIFREAAAAAAAPLRAVSSTDVGAVTTAMDGTAFDIHTATWGRLHLHSPLPGAHQALNAALAVLLLDAMPPPRPTHASVIRGVAATRWAGRLQLEYVAGVPWLFDVAHNVAGVEALVAALRGLPLARPVAAVVGVLGDKDWSNMLAPLHRAADRVILTSPPTAPADRRWDAAAALDAAPAPHALIVPGFIDALERAHDFAAGTGGTVVVTGSFHTVGDALSALGRCPDGSDFRLTRPAFLQ